MIIKTKNAEERRQLAGILLENGYRVEIVKIREGRTTKTAIKAEKIETEVIDENA